MFQTYVFFQSICPGMVHTEILPVGGHEFPDGQSSDEFYASIPHLKCQDISDAIIYVLGTPPHVHVWQFNMNTLIFWAVPSVRPTVNLSSFSKMN